MANINDLPQKEREILLENILEKKVIYLSEVPDELARSELDNLNIYRDKYVAHAEDILGCFDYRVVKLKKTLNEWKDKDPTSCGAFMQSLKLDLNVEIDIQTLGSQLKKFMKDKKDGKPVISEFITDVDESLDRWIKKKDVSIFNPLSFYQNIILNSLANIPRTEILARLSYGFYAFVSQLLKSGLPMGGGLNVYTQGSPSFDDLLDKYERDIKKDVRNYYNK